MSLKIIVLCLSLPVAFACKNSGASAVKAVDSKAIVSCIKGHAAPNNLQLGECADKAHPLVASGDTIVPRSAGWTFVSATPCVSTWALPMFCQSSPEVIKIFGSNQPQEGIDDTNATIQMQDDGNVVVYASNTTDSILGASNTVGTGASLIYKGGKQLVVLDNKGNAIK